MTAQGSPDNAIKGFLEEAEEISDRLGAELADLVDAAESGNLDPDLLNSIFRGAHSLKGLAGMFGLANILNVSHALESLLDRLRLGKLGLNKALLTLLLESHMLLEALLRDVSTGKLDAHGGESAACVARIGSSLAASEADAGDEKADQAGGLPQRLLDSLTEFEEHRLQENLTCRKQLYFIQASFELSVFDQELARLTEKLKSCGEVISTLPGIGDRIETHIDFEILFGSDLLPEELETLVGADNILVIRAGQQPAADHQLPEPLPDAARPAAAHSNDTAESGQPVQATAAGSAPTGAEDLSLASLLSSTVRVDIGKLDELMNTVGDLVLSHLSIALIAQRLHSQGLSGLGSELLNATRQLERRLTDLRKGVLEIRMIPVGRLYEKMNRIVRKISGDQGKRVELEFVGGDTELDKLIIEEISDPLMHIIRNAIDHGIETPEMRTFLGKDPRGTIRVSACQKGSHVVIEIKDDGSGIDLEQVRSTALSRGLVDGPGGLTDREALDLVFRPGFSTSATVSQVSGRGVGLDVVKSNIAAIAGQVDIETWPGLGTSFSLTIPITLAMIKALIVSSAGRNYALPTSAVFEALLLNRRDSDSGIIHLRGSTLPLLRLDRYFAIDRGEPSPDESYAVVVGLGERRIGLVVDDLIGQQDIVIKPLGPALRGWGGICGAADLGDQRTILVLDVAAIIAETMKVGS